MANFHALIIEDDAYNVYVMERFLDRVNISYTTITQTAKLEETVESCDQIDIVLLDLEMPQRDGYEVFEFLKGHLKADIPIIACSVHTAEINRTREVGFSGFIAKPLDTDRFPEQINRILYGEAVWEAR